MSKIAEIDAPVVMALRRTFAGRWRGSGQTKRLSSETTASEILVDVTGHCRRTKYEGGRRGWVRFVPGFLRHPAAWTFSPVPESQVTVSQTLNTRLTSRVLGQSEFPRCISIHCSEQALRHPCVALIISLSSIKATRKKRSPRRSNSNRPTLPVMTRNCRQIDFFGSTVERPVPERWGRKRLLWRPPGC